MGYGYVGTSEFRAHLLGVIGEAVIVTDLDGTITYWNQAAEELYGWPAGESWSGEFMVQRRDGSSFPALVRDVPLHDEQRVRRRISQILHDDLQQQLYGIQVKRSFICRAGKAAADEPVQQHVQDINTWVSQAIETTRQLAVSLSPRSSRVRV